MKQPTRSWMDCFLYILLSTVAVVLLTPIFYPVITAMGGDLVYFGVLLVFALSIGQISINYRKPDQSALAMAFEKSEAL